MAVLLYQIYGNRRLYHLELSYSILSAARFLRQDPAGIRIVLAADAANMRPDLEVEHLLMTPEMLDEWQMQGSYNHAIQAYALDHALHVYDEPVVLIDSDTILHRHPREMFDRIGAGRSLMHLREGRLDESISWPQWQDLIARSGGAVAGYPLAPESVMFNAGVLGLHPQDRALLTDVKAAMAEIRQQSDMFTAVQLAASLVFAARSDLQCCGDLVEHYWGARRAYYHYQLRRIFPKILSGQGIADPAMALPPLAERLDPALRHRVMARLYRLRRGGGAEFGSAMTAYLSALSQAPRDPEIANVWASQMLDMLQWGMRGQAVRREDFPRFAPEAIAGEDWLEADLLGRWRDYWRNA